MNIRKVQLGDGKDLVELFKKLDSESEFMLLEPDERDLSIENQESIVLSFLNSNSQVMFVAESLNENLVGYIVGIGGKFNRNTHSLSCVLGVAAAHQGKGLGGLLLAELESWAKLNKFHRLELTVMEHNHKAISLYKRMCFEVEGLKRHSLKIAGNYVSELSMAKLLNA